MKITPIIGSGGFGNEFFQVAKAWICAKHLNLTYQSGYWKNNYYSDVFTHDVVHCSSFRHQTQKLYQKSTCSVVAFSQQEHINTGIIPIEIALESFLFSRSLKKNKKILIEMSGLYPGLESIEKYSQELYCLLLKNPGFLYTIKNRLTNVINDSICIGVHIRRGDFKESLPLGVSWPQNQWNIGVPLEWYDYVCNLIKTELGEKKIHFIIFTNSIDSNIIKFSSKYKCSFNEKNFSNHRSSQDVIDLIALANCDLVVSSVSWFSGWAVTLGQVPFVWYPYAHGLPQYGKDRCFGLDGTQTCLPTKLKLLIETRYNTRISKKTKFLLPES